MPGLRVGHATDLEHATGCTVVLCPPAGCVAGVDCAARRPARAKPTCCGPGQLVERANAILLAGGSAFGLAAADGVMRYLEEHGLGFPVGVTVVPIVPAAIIFDLTVGDFRVRPDAAMGYAACVAASDEPVAEGSVGAGHRRQRGQDAGPGGRHEGRAWARPACALGDGLVVAALMVVNAAGDIVDPASGGIVAGARLPGGGWADSAALLVHGAPIAAGADEHGHRRRGHQRSPGQGPGQQSGADGARWPGAGRAPGAHHV